MNTIEVSDVLALVNAPDPAARIESMPAGELYAAIDMLAAMLGHPATYSPHNAAWRASAVTRLGQLRLAVNAVWDAFEVHHG